MSTPIPYQIQPDQGPIAVPSPLDETVGGGGPQFEGPSFELLNIKWGNPSFGTPSGVVTWSFATFNSSVQPEDVTYNPPMPTFFQDEVRAAFDAWEAVADIDFVEVSDSSNVDIRVGVGSVDGAGSTLGVAYYSFSGITFNQVHIIMDSVDFSSTSDSGVFYLTMLHEIGHAIGLDHENGISSIMSSFINTSLTGLTGDDLAAVQLLYGGGEGFVLDDHPVDGFGTDASIVVGGSVAGNIESSYDKDWFSVDVIAGRIYQFDLSGDTLVDAYLSLRAADNSLYLFNDDGGPGYDSRITFTATETCTLYLVAEAYSSGAGTYTLTALDISPPPIPGITLTEGLSDSPGSIGTSDVVISGDTFEGRLANGTDHDFVRIELQAGVSYTFELNGADTEGGTLVDPVLSLRNANGGLIVSNDDGGTVFDPSITYTPTVSGSYYLEASTDQTSGGTYSLVTSPDQRTVLDSVDNPGMTVSEGGNDVPGSNVSDRGIDPGDSFVGTLSSSQDTDYIRINMVDRFEYTFEAQGADSDGGTLPNPFLELRDKFGNLITSNNNSGPGLDALLTYTATKSDYYFLVVRTTGSEGGSYTLTAAESDDPIPVVVQEGTADAPASISTSIDLTIGDTFEGEISALSDIDYVRVELTGGARYVFDMIGKDSGEGTLEDPFLVLRNSEGSVLRQNEDGGILSASRIVFVPEDSGTYYLSAHTPAVGGGLGTYTLFTEQTVTPYPGIVVREGEDDAPNFLAETEMFVGGSFTGTIDPDDDNGDAVTVELVAGIQYTIDLKGSDSGSGTLGDPYLKIYGSDLESKRQNDNGGEGRDSQIVYTPSVSGTYILAIDGATGILPSTGTYELSVKETSLTQSAEVVAPLDDGYTVSSTDPLDVLANLVDTGQFSS